MRLRAEIADAFISFVENKEGLWEKRIYLEEKSFPPKFC